MPGDDPFVCMQCRRMHSSFLDCKNVTYPVLFGSRMREVLLPPDLPTKSIEQRVADLEKTVEVLLNQFR